MSRLTIVRGLPGSGKSTYARRLSAENGVMLVEPDMLMVRNGEYCYTPEDYLHSIQKAIDIARKLIMGRADCIYADVLPMVSDVKYIINRISFHIDWFSYEIVDMPLITIDESIKKNIHKVRLEDIQRMFNQWEPWSGNNS